MPTFNYLPGVQIKTNDGGLTASRVPSSKAVLIIGTSGNGPANDPYTVVDRSTAALTYGLDGTLVRAMEEAALGGCDNITLFRMGTGQATLSNIGLQTSTATSLTPTTPTASASGTASTTTLTVAGALDTVSGTLSVQVGSGSAHVLTVPAGTSIATLASLINADSTFQTDLVTAVATTSTVLTISGPATASSTLVVSPTSLHDTPPPATSGFAIQFGQVTTDTSTRYKIWYKNGVLYLYLDGQIVYAYDSANFVAVDTQDSTIVGIVVGNSGVQLGTGSTPSIDAAITVAAAGAVSAGSNQVVPTYVDSVTGLGLTGRQTYIALAQALDLLSNFPTDVVYCPNAVVDQPNVAYYVATDSTTSANNPATNPDALDWLLVTVDGQGDSTYQWANDTIDSNGNAVTAMVATTAADRLSAGFFEVHFPYILATFCQLQESVGLNGTCIGFMGTNGPVTFKLTDLRNWVGFLPTYDVIITTKADAPGKGLLGTPIFAGTTSAKLNHLCVDYANGYRTDGIFLTAEGQYDGTIETDDNGNNIDIGAYLHIAADYAALSNGYARNYSGNIAGVVAGYFSTLDPKVTLTFKTISAVQLWKPSEGQLDSLTRIGFNVLRFTGNGQLPVLLHGQTEATPVSDFVSLLRQNIKGLAVKTIRQVAANFIGFGNLDGLQQQSLVTALTKNFTTLQQKGYLNNFNFSVTTTAADLAIGHGSISVTFHPADELVQLTATVGFVPSS